MKRIFFLFIALFFGACASKNTSFNSQSVLLSVSSNSMRFSEAGFLKENSKTLDLEIYKLGQAFFELKIRDKICLNSVCYDKKNFNEKFFQNAYYDDILKDILLAKPLWKGHNLEKNECGFSQKLKKSSYDIFYEVCDDKSTFFDKKTKMKIILKKFH